MSQNPLFTCPLKTLRRGQSAIVEDVCGPSCVCERLSALGFTAGAMVRMITGGRRSAAVQVGETRVVLRGEPLEAIQVSVLK
jgi:Fe2+ transport system protein FeoA